MLVLAGGPGEDVIGALPLLATGSVFSRLARDRDVVLYDMRGVGASRPALDCPEVTALQAASPTTAQAETDLAVAALSACHDRLVADGRDLSAYTTAENAADVDDVRQALGFPQVDLLAGSYGTEVGLAAVRGNPTWVRTLTLTSPIPLQANYVADAGPTFQAALDRVVTSCAGQPACAAAYPDLGDLLAATAAQLAAKPAQVTIPAVGDRPAQTVTFTVADFTNSLFALFYDPRLIEKLPALVTAVKAGDFTLLLALSSGGASGTTVGLQATILCAEPYAWADRAQVAAQAAGLSPLVGQDWLPFQPLLGLPGFTVCQHWAVPPAPASTFEPVTSSVRTLIVTGAYDQITSPSYGPLTAAGLPNAAVVRVAGAGHSALTSTGQCGLTILTGFLDDPTATPGAACADKPVAFDLPPTRLAGVDRYATAAAVAVGRYQPGVARAYVATGTDFADALTVEPVAGRQGAPVLLSIGTSLPAVTRAALATLRPGEIVVVGGRDAVPDSVLAELTALTTGSVTREAGASRFATSAAVLRANATTSVRRVFLATGEDFADALAAAPLAAQPGNALLLTAKGTLPAASADAMRDLHPQEVVVLGGTNAVADPVLDGVRRLLPAATVGRLAGPDRYTTAALIAAAGFPDGTPTVFAAVAGQVRVPPDLGSGHFEPTSLVLGAGRGRDLGVVQPGEGSAHFTPA